MLLLLALLFFSARFHQGFSGVGAAQNGHQLLCLGRSQFLRCLLSLLWCCSMQHMLASFQRTRMRPVIALMAFPCSCGSLGFALSYLFGRIAECIVAFALKGGAQLGGVVGGCVPLVDYKVKPVTHTMEGQSVTDIKR